MASESVQTNDDLEAADPGELSRKKRINSIHQARVGVRDVDKRVEELKMERLIGDAEGLRALRKAVEHYIMELEPIIQTYELDEEQVDFDDHPGWWGRYAENADGEEILIGPDLGVMLLPDGRMRQFIGLRSIVEAENPITVEIEEVVEEKYDEPQTVVRREQRQIPRHILMAAYRACNEFVFEIGLDVNFDEGRPFSDWRGESADGV